MAINNRLERGDTVRMSGHISQTRNILTRPINEGCMLNMVKEECDPIDTNYSQIHMKHICCIMSSYLYFHSDAHIDMYTENIS